MVGSTHVNAYINVVRRDKPKMLTGLSHHGTVAGTGAVFSPVVDTQRHRRKERTYPILVSTRNTATPHLSRKGRTIVKSNHGDAGKVRRTKRTPHCNGVDRGCAIDKITPRASGQTGTVATEWAVSQDHQKPVETAHVPEQNELGYSVGTADSGSSFSRSSYCPLRCNKTHGFCRGCAGCGKSIGQPYPVRWSEQVKDDVSAMLDGWS